MRFLRVGTLHVEASVRLCCLRDSHAGGEKLCALAVLEEEPGYPFSEIGNTRV